MGAGALIMVLTGVYTSTVVASGFWLDEVRQRDTHLDHGFAQIQQLLPGPRECMDSHFLRFDLAALPVEGS